MKRALTPAQSRLLAIVLLLAVVALAALAVYVPWQRLHQHYDTAIEDQLDRTARYLRIAAQQNSVEANIAAIKKLKSERYYLTASAPALAAAEVQQMALAIVEANQVKVESTQIAPHKDEGTHRRVVVNFRLRAPLPAMQKALYELEAVAPYLYIDNLVALSSVARVYRPAPGVEPDVQVQFDLYGFARIPAPGVKPG